MRTNLTLASVALLSCRLLLAQSALPAAPGPQLLSSLQQPEAMPPAAGTQQPTAPAPDANLPALTLAQAEQMAIRNNPQITVGKLEALAQHEITRETRSAELPSATIAATAVQAEEASRIGAGSLTSSRLRPHT